MDPGGDLYVYVGTEQCLQGLSGKVAGWRQFLEAIPDLNAENRQHLNQAIDAATNLIRTSGIEELRGLGLSSIPREDGLHHSKTLRGCTMHQELDPGSSGTCSVASRMR